MNAERSAFLLKLWERHIETEFSEKSAVAAVDTMVPHATVNHVPTMTGALGLQLMFAWSIEPGDPAFPLLAPPHGPRHAPYV